ncbi:MAG: SAM-dependent methyltransferase, partial [Pseudomonadota bacterium]|nr:SAM-dependent methyltransferase [Pseudomonadota bacterium]
MVEDARGQRHVFGDGEPPRAGIRIKSRALERRIFFTPKLAIGEGYMDGELEIIEGDLYDFLDLCMANLGNLPQSRFHRWAETLRDKVALWQTFNP